MQYREKSSPHAAAVCEPHVVGVEGVGQDDMRLPGHLTRRQSSL